MDIEAFSDALDSALTDVAESEFNRLSCGMSHADLDAKVHEVLDDLRKLRDGDPPDYRDPWVALLYLTWYQASQIQLTYRQIKVMNQGRTINGLTADEKTPLRIVDFGCGTRAMQYALAWVAGESMECGRSIPVIYVYGYDPSVQMVNLGERLWRCFKVEMEKKAEFKHLNKFLEAIRIRSCLNELLSTPAGRGERRLGAMHVVYDSNVPSVKEGLARFAREFSPDVAFLTSHDDQESKSRLEAVSLFHENEYYVSSNELKSDMRLDLPKVTEWRKDLNSRISRPHWFLNNPVNWTFRDSFGLTYTSLE